MGIPQMERTRVRGRWNVVTFVFTLLALLGPLVMNSMVEAAGHHYLVVVTGLGGEPRYKERFHQWALSMVDAASEQYGLSDSDIWYLGEKPELDPERIHAKSTKENVVQTFTELGERVRPGDLVFVLLIGHGSFNSGESRINLPGPDMTADDFARLLDGLGTQNLVFVNTSSASGGFLEALSRKDRVVVTATKSGLERNESVFGGYFVQAYADGGADVNKDGRISVLEAFDFACRNVDRFYEEGNRLKTEHAVLDDDGDGKGMHPSDESREASPDGQVAARTILGGRPGAVTREADSADGVEDPELAALVRQVQSLEDRIEGLKQQKDTMAPELYFEELEKLLLDLALKKRALQELEGEEPTRR
jgi:hypothetical protein